MIGDKLGLYRSMAGAGSWGITRQRRASVASTSTPSSQAKRSPMHSRDPAPNGK